MTNKENRTNSLEELWYIYEQFNHIMNMDNGFTKAEIKKLDTISSKLLNFVESANERTK